MPAPLTNKRDSRRRRESTGANGFAGPNHTHSPRRFCSRFASPPRSPKLMATGRWLARQRASPFTPALPVRKATPIDSGRMAGALGVVGCGGDGDRRARGRLRVLITGGPPRFRLFVAACCSPGPFLLPFCSCRSIEPIDRSIDWARGLAGSLAAFGWTRRWRPNGWSVGVGRLGSVSRQGAGLLMVFAIIIGGLGTRPLTHALLDQSRPAERDSGPPRI